jgi:hypothetical protein
LYYSEDVMGSFKGAFPDIYTFRTEINGGRWFRWTPPDDVEQIIKTKTSGLPDALLSDVKSLYADAYTGKKSLSWNEISQQLYDKLEKADEQSLSAVPPTQVAADQTRTDTLKAQRGIQGANPAIPAQVPTGTASGPYTPVSALESAPSLAAPPQGYRSYTDGVAAPAPNAADILATSSATTPLASEPAAAPPVVAPGNAGNSTTPAQQANSTTGLPLAAAPASEPASEDATQAERSPPAVDIKGQQARKAFRLFNRHMGQLHADAGQANNPGQRRLAAATGGFGAALLTFASKLSPDGSGESPTLADMAKLHRQLLSSSSQDDAGGLADHKAAYRSLLASAGRDGAKIAENFWHAMGNDNSRKLQHLSALTKTAIDPATTTVGQLTESFGGQSAPAARQSSDAELRVSNQPTAAVTTSDAASTDGSKVSALLQAPRRDRSMSLG